MAPKGRGRRKADIVENALEANVVPINDEIKGEKPGKAVKAPKKGKKAAGSNVVNGSVEKIDVEEHGEVTSESEMPAGTKTASKGRQKAVKTKDKEDSAEEEKEGGSKVKENNPKNLPAKRGRKAAKIENGIDLLKDSKDNNENDTDVITKDAQRSRRKLKAEPKETKADKTPKAQAEVLVEKEISTKRAGRKRKAAEPEKVEDDKQPQIDENCQLRVALKRNRSLDEMARQQMENDEDFEEPKVKIVKGPAKSKGKRAAKDTTEDSSQAKKNKADTKSKGASKKEKIPDVTALDFSNESKTADGKSWNLKIATWNVNGLRAWIEKNGMSYLHHELPDILCVQETKCSDDKLPSEVNVDGYHSYWLAGDKDGYSGVGLLSKEEPVSVQYGIGIDKHDNEGRVITAEYENFFLVTTYIPNAGRGLIRLDYRQEWDKDFRAYIKKLDEKKPVVLCGDLNVAHEEIDLANPKTNKKNAGFTKEEREGFSTLLSEGFIDTFRYLYPDKAGAYTFWTYMMNARAKNVGWRLDYFVISKRFVDHLCDSVIRKDVFGSDHCPIALFLHV